MSDSNSSSGGIGVFGLLGVAFVVLKLLHVIDWSWWYVTMPFWGGLVLLAAFFALLGLGWLVVWLLGLGWLVVWLLDWRNRRRHAARRAKART